jgi:dTDP-4-amino-4,6-dideoxygalactose transaminase
MSTKPIRSSRPFFPPEDISLILQDIRLALEEGRLRNGKNLSAFEKLFADYLKIENAVAFDSDSSAFETILHYFGVKDREVIVCTNSFISVPNSVLYSGAKVVFADIREDTLSIDVQSVKNKISDKTCGVIVTHIAGFPNPDLKEIIRLCKDNDLFLIEDATHAVGATVEGQKAGTFGDAAVFAFTPTKILTTGEGAMLVSNDNKLAEEAKRFSYYGSGTGKTNFVNLGRHMMLSEISAIMGLYQLKRVEEFITWRNEIAAIYNKVIDKSIKMHRVRCTEGCRCSYYKYPLILDESVDTKQFTQILMDQFGVETGNVFYPPCHLQTVYKKLSAQNRMDTLPVAEKVLSQTITLPMHAALSKDEAKYVMNSCLYTLEQLSK